MVEILHEPNYEDIFFQSLFQSVKCETAFNSSGMCMDTNVSLGDLGGVMVDKTEAPVKILG